MYEEQIKILKNNISLTYGEQITSYNSGYIGDVFSEIATNNIDIYYSDIFNWARDNTWYVDESIKEYGSCNDIVKQIQMAQGYAFESELYQTKDDILKYYAYNYLKDNEIELSEEEVEDLENYIEHLDNNGKLDSINDYCDSFKEIGYETSSSHIHISKYEKISNFKENEICL